MNSLIWALAASWLAGLAAFAGGTLASLETTVESEGKQALVHGVVAFGGGVLVAAVAFALAPAAIARLSAPALALTFCAGGAVFCALDARLGRRGGTRAQFIAMVVDFVPEALSLGAVFAHDARLGLLLAVYIAAQNFPEGFNAYREVVAGGWTRARALKALFAVSLLGPLAAATGHALLQDHGGLTAAIMSFAAGGILYLVFQDIAPQAKMRLHWTPPLGAVLGFLTGMLAAQQLA